MTIDEGMYVYRLTPLPFYGLFAVIDVLILVKYALC